jgi:hypothetical protein
LATARDPIDAVGTMKFPGDTFLIGFMVIFVVIAVIMWFSGPRHDPTPIATGGIGVICAEGRVLTSDPDGSYRCAKP